MLLLFFEIVLIFYFSINLYKQRNCLTDMSRKLIIEFVVKNKIGSLLPYRTDGRKLGSFCSKKFKRSKQ